MARISSNATNWKILSNVLLLILCGLPGIILELVVWDPSFPFQRGFFCNDENIRYPYKDSTVSTVLSSALCLGVPLVGMVVIEMLLYKHFKPLGELTRPVPSYRCIKVLCLKVPGYVVAVFATYIPFLFASGVTLSLTDILKYMVGRLRPHFLAVCRPDLAAIQCVNASGFSNYVQEFSCADDAERHLLLDARLSFPSGHASTAACCFIYFAIYLQFRMVWNGPSLLRPLIQAVLVTGAVMIAASRVSDYKHFWSDVVFGFLLGAVVGILVSFFVSDLYFNETPADDFNGAQSKELNAPTSETDLSTILTIAPHYQSTNSSSGDVNNSSGKRPTNI